MNSNFINPTLTRASELGVGLYEDSHPIELTPHASSAEIELVIRAIYRQILGNAHIMESDRLTVAESLLKNGDITVRGFICNLVKSELYRALFFDNYTSLRAIELNFKHLLGRAPHSYEEIVQHSHILHEEGYEAEIDSYLDSEEYLTNFGEHIVPYYQGYKTQTGKKVIIQGLQDFIVVEKDGVLLICPRKDDQDIKQIMKDAKDNFGEEYV